ncbi:methyltransferase domain-containing protein [Vibrio ponticus]|nr:methyltransferase domain-containing protein [Vibrio ponticus]
MSIPFVLSEGLNMDKSAVPQIDAQFWDELFTTGNMPWDNKQSPNELLEFLGKYSLPALTQSCSRVFIPGCGAAYEVKAFTRYGCDVTAMDYSEQAVAVAKDQLGELGNSVVLGDVFKADFAQPFDVIYERAFLAALPREYWHDYFAMLDRLLPSGGLIIGYFVVSDEYRSRFPPFCLKTNELAQALGSKFELISSSPVDDSVAVFAGKEHWMIWQKI